MCDRNRPAFCNLFPEQRNNRPIRSQNISETDCNETGMRTSRPHLHVFRPTAVYIRMSMHHRKNIFTILIADTVKGLDDHFTQTLAGTHDIRRIHRFVRTDQYKTIHSIFHSSKGCLIGTNHIILYSLTRTVLHKRYMFMCRCMEHDLRTISFKDLHYTPAVTYRTNQNNEIKVRILSLQFLLNIIRIVLNRYRR